MKPSISKILAASAVLYVCIVERSTLIFREAGESFIREDTLRHFICILSGSFAPNAKKRSAFQHSSREIDAKTRRLFVILERGVRMNIFRSVQVTCQSAGVACSKGFALK